MEPTIFKNSAKDFTLEQAVKAYKEGIAIAVNDGKDLTITIEGMEEDEN